MINVSEPGFADPVQDAQSCFRALLAAMSRPGTDHRIAVGLCPPAPLDPATAAVLLTLADPEITLWIEPRFDAATAWIVFHCGARISTDRSEARFVLTTTLPDFYELNCGSDEVPEDAATIILQVPSLDNGPAMRLAGPGLATVGELRAAGLPESFVAIWRDNHALYPRGVDLILCAGNSIAALPRSIEVF